jgi:phage terminase small subunit
VAINITEAPVQSTQTEASPVVDQSRLVDFVSNSNSQSESYECEICGDSFDSSKGRGIHRAHSHSEEKIKEVLIEELQDLADELGETPSQRDMTRQGAHSVKTYQKKFGSWNEALEKADLEINKKQSIAKSELIDELTRLSAELGRTPTSRDVAEEGEYAPSNYSNKFESWNSAVREAGLEITRQRDISRDDLLGELKRLANELGHTPTVGAMRQRGKFGVRTYSKEFGSWNDALQDAGLELNRRQDVDESELLEEISRLYDEFGRPPSVDIMNNDGDFAVSTY